MSYTPTEWEDRIVQNPRTFQVQENQDGTVTLIPRPGTVAQEGTPVNAANLNNLEQGLVTHLADYVQHLENYADPHKHEDEGEDPDWSGVRYRLVMIDGEPFMEVVAV